VSERAITLKTWYYVHGDADHAHPVPESSFVGWQAGDLEISLDHTAVVSMHVWDCGAYELYPGWHKVVPYIPRAAAITRSLFPRLFEAVRKSPIPLIHVVGGGNYYSRLKGYKKTVELAGKAPDMPEHIPSDPVRDKLLAFKEKEVYPRSANLPDVKRGFARLNFDEHAKPAKDEYICENGHQLFAVCKQRNINHLIYAGFAVDMCLLLEPGGMNDMSKRGMLCSIISDTTVAVEIKESAERQLAREIGLWRVAHLYGFVYEAEEFIRAINSQK
jgi:hypothetical protein